MAFKFPEPVTNKLAVGDKVAFNNLADADWFTITAIDGFELALVWSHLPNPATTFSDKSLVKRVVKADGKLWRFTL